MSESSKIFYKKYIIEPAPRKLKDGGWDTELYISKVRNEYVLRQFLSDRIHKTKEDAVKYCIQYAQHIIDGKIKDCSVDDL